MKLPPDEVKRVVESSGYPLEIRIAHSLAKRGYYVTPSWVYRDPTSHESREVDVAAWRLYSLRDEGRRSGIHRGDMGLHLLIECKRVPAVVIYSAKPREILTRANDANGKPYFGEPRTLWRSASTGEFVEDVVGLGAQRWSWPDCVGSHFTFVYEQRGRGDEVGVAEPNVLPLSGPFNPQELTD